MRGGRPQKAGGGRDAGFWQGSAAAQPVFEPVRGLLYVTTELENSVTVVDPESWQSWLDPHG